jgi:pimeloyl-ACP methyl ester carboxylesterase
MSALDEATGEMFGRHATIERPGCRIHYWLAGAPDAPLVTLSHAALTDHTFFATQVSALVSRYQVLTWDIRGHGASRPLAGPGVPEGRRADHEGLAVRESEEGAGQVRRG